MGAKRVTVLPYFLSAGVHINRDIPGEIEKASQNHPNLEIKSGILDYTFFRDDFRSTHKILSPNSTEIDFQVEGKKVVFVKTEKGFEPKAIHLGVVNQDYAEVLSGLHKGDLFVAKNGFIVKSELDKSEMSSGHNH